jgi:hypothetical protein
MNRTALFLGLFVSLILAASLASDPPPLEFASLQNPALSFHAGDRVDKPKKATISANRNEHPIKS